MMMPDRVMPRIAVGSLADARRHASLYGAVLTVEDACARDGYRTSAVPQEVLVFDDVEFRPPAGREPVPGWVPVDEGHVARALAFAAAHAGVPLFVHCREGRSRSASLALAVIADRLGQGEEGRAAAELLTVCPGCVPNLLVLSLADAVLGRGGRLVSAWRRLEEGPGMEGVRRVRFMRAAWGGNPSSGLPV